MNIQERLHLDEQRDKRRDGRRLRKEDGDHAKGVLGQNCASVEVGKPIPPRRHEVVGLDGAERAERRLDLAAGDHRMLECASAV